LQRDDLTYTVNINIHFCINFLHLRYVYFPVVFLNYINYYILYTFLLTITCCNCSPAYNFHIQNNQTNLICHIIYSSYYIYIQIYVTSIMHLCSSQCTGVWSPSWLVRVDILFHHDILMLCMIWKTAEPHTTNKKRAIRAGPTGDFSSLLFNVLGIFPLAVMFLLCLSLAILILCLLAMMLKCFNMARLVFCVFNT